MAGMKAEHINAFLGAAATILQQMCQISVKVGKPFIKPIKFEDGTVSIVIGVTGNIRGQVFISMPMEVATDIAGKMCMMPVAELDEISKSALSELGNMTLGNAATLLGSSNIHIDITPPTLMIGGFLLSSQCQIITIPLSYEEGKVIEINVSLVEAD